MQAAAIVLIAVSLVRCLQTRNDVGRYGLESIKADKSEEGFSQPLLVRESIDSYDQGKSTE